LNILCKLSSLNMNWRLPSWKTFYYFRVTIYRFLFYIFHPKSYFILFLRPPSLPFKI
jgi:hypothetical protein